MGGSFNLLGESSKIKEEIVFFVDSEISKWFGVNRSLNLSESRQNKVLSYHVTSVGRGLNLFLSDEG